MMTSQDRDAIDDLFDRIDNVARNNPEREPEAERLIADRIGRAPEAAYYMAQTILVQEQALAAAQEKIAQLEGELESRQSGGFLGGLFGSDRPERRPAYRAPQPQQFQGGGFLAGAAQTALGVTGGLLLGNAIAGMFSSDPAMADEQAADDQSAVDDGGGDFGGDEFGF